MDNEDQIPQPSSDDPETEAVLFNFLLEHIPDRIYFKDKASRFIRVSRAKAERHGIPDPSRMIGKIDLDLFTFEHAMEALEDEKQILRTGEEIVGKVEKETMPNGRTEWALTTKMPLRDQDGEIIGTCGISKDISALKEMEDALATANTELEKTLGELQATHEELKRTQGQLVEAEKAQTAARLAAGVAHEVRNPLNILSTGIGFLSSSTAVSDDETMSVVIGEMHDAIRRADAVICALMDSSKDSLLHLEKCGLNALVESALESRQREFETQQVKVNRELADDLPELSLDASRIMTALDCLLHNALDAMEAGTGEITVRTTLKQPEPSEGGFDPGARAGQRHRAGGTVVVLEIEDSGNGISTESLPAIFDPFFTTKATGSGTGLGLTVCRKILELHGASIGVTNRAEGGVRVRIVFPC